MREQSDKFEVLKSIASLLQRLAKLYQIPNWSEENAILLAQWIFDNFKYETFETIRECLYNPPITGQKNWRLTPDTITEWMVLKLDEVAIKREAEHERNKQIEQDNNDYILPDFDKLFKGTWYDDERKKREYDEIKQREFKEKYFKDRETVTYTEKAGGENDNGKVKA